MNLLFVDQCSGWIRNNENLDYLLFYNDSLNLVEKGNTKLKKSILKGKETNLPNYDYLLRLATQN